MTDKQLEQIQKTLDTILNQALSQSSQNINLLEEVALLKKDNYELRKKAEDKEERIQANVVKWMETEEEAFALADKLARLKEQLVKDQVREEFFRQETKIEDLCRRFEELGDKFIDTQAVEMDILQFEQSIQDPRESIGQFMDRLKRSVREAYEGDAQRELDRKVAWRFVSGLADRRIQEKIFDAGWMRSRHASKELDELQEIAEHSEEKDDTSSSTSKSPVSISDTELDTIAVFNSGGGMHRSITPPSESGSGGSRSRTPSSKSKSKRSRNDVSSSKSNSKESRSKTASSESRSSRGTDGSEFPSSRKKAELENLKCYFCNKAYIHKGGWRHCPKRKRENPTWKPKKSDVSSDRIMKHRVSVESA